MVNSTAHHEKRSAKYSFSCNALLISGRTVKIPQYVLQNPTKSGKLHQRDLAFFLAGSFVDSVSGKPYIWDVCVCYEYETQCQIYSHGEKVLKID